MFVSVSQVIGWCFVPVRRSTCNVVPEIARIIYNVEIVTLDSTVTQLSC